MYGGPSGEPFVWHDFGKTNPIRKKLYTTRSASRRYAQNRREIGNRTEKVPWEYTFGPLGVHMRKMGSWEYRLPPFGRTRVHSAPRAVPSTQTQKGRTGVHIPLPRRALSHRQATCEATIRMKTSTRTLWPTLLAVMMSTSSARKIRIPDRD